ncbi:hypothetical protein JVT61DRAFT_13716 [Boletus reticuloceps]|uniref:Uncharacterized protein n=1 Tax=Boletus reticuloceps TaxID=495285 RepID=A0A8I3AD02_9AGAM|nr:hypothetical protein JVT61DRAFT_13716 [Boletus reticuloceps]
MKPDCIPHCQPTINEPLKPCFKYESCLFSLNIPDLDGGPATLYMSNGSMRPPTPQVGDFFYDFSAMMFHIYFSDGWVSFTLEDMESLVCHPSGNNAVMLFTGRAIPYWMLTVTLGLGGNPEIEFDSVNTLFTKFEMIFDPKDFMVVRIPAEKSKMKKLGSKSRKDTRTVTKNKVSTQSILVSGNQGLISALEGAFAGPSTLREGAKDPVSKVINTRIE